MPASVPKKMAKPEFQVLYEHFGRLAADMVAATKLHKAPLNIGSARELFVASFLKRHLPRSLWVARGEILDSTGSRSGDCDVVVYRASCPAVPSDPGESLFLFFAEGVDSVLEVKSTLSAGELTNCFAACRRIKGLRTGNKPGTNPGAPDIAIVPEGYNPDPLNRVRYFVVAFDGLTDDSIVKNLEAEFKTPADYHHNAPDGICLLDRSYIYKNDGLIWPSGDAAAVVAHSLTRSTDDLLCLYLHLVSGSLFTVHKGIHFADYLDRGVS